MLSPDSYRWDDIRAFLALWRSGSLLAAAKQLGVNPSTVGRRLDALEDALDTQLFERSPEGVIATLAAERLLPFAEAIERSHQELSQALSGLEREPVGTVRVTGPPGLVDHFLAPAVSELRAHFPGIKICLDASVGYADLSRGEADIALRGTRPERGDLVVQKLGPFASCVIGAPHLYRKAKPATKLSALPWIQWGDDLSHIPDARFIHEQIDNDAIVLRTSSFAAQLEATRSGLGVMLAARPFADLQGLCALGLKGKARKIIDAHPRQPLYLVGHQALRRVPRVAVVWSFLKEKIEGFRGQ